MRLAPDGSSIGDSVGMSMFRAGLGSRSGRVSRPLNCRSLAVADKEEIYSCELSGTNKKFAGVRRGLITAHK